MCRSSVFIKPISSIPCIVNLGCHFFFIKEDSLSAEFGHRAAGHTALLKESKHKMTLIPLCLFNIQIDILEALVVFSTEHNGS